MTTIVENPITTTTDDTLGSSSSRKRIFLLLENPSKSNNLGPILRCASAFGITTVIFIGYAQCNVEGSHGAAKHVQIVHFPTCNTVVTNYLQTELDCHTIIGIMGCVPDGYDHEHGHDIYETADGNNTTFIVPPTTTTVNQCIGKSFPVHSFPFSKKNTTSKNVCFVVSKQMQGLPMTLFRACNAYVHVPFSARLFHNHHDDDATTISSSSTNTEKTHCPLLIDSPACLSIVLHEFTTLSMDQYYDERIFQGHKFHVQMRNRIHNKQDIGHKKSQRAAEKQKQAETAQLIIDDGFMTSLFHEEER